MYIVCHEPTSGIALRHRTIHLHRYSWYNTTLSKRYETNASLETSLCGNGIVSREPCDSFGFEKVVQWKRLQLELHPHCPGR